MWKSVEFDILLVVCGIANHSPLEIKKDDDEMAPFRRTRECDEEQKKGHKQIKSQNGKYKTRVKKKIQKGLLRIKSVQWNCNCVTFFAV